MSHIRPILEIPDAHEIFVDYTSIICVVLAEVDKPRKISFCYSSIKGTYILIQEIND